MNAYPPLSDSTVDLSVETFRMLSDATRVKLLWQMCDQERSVNQLAEALGKPQAMVSQHLGKLRQARLVSRGRRGRHVFYGVTNDHVRQLVADVLFHAEHIGPGPPSHHLARTGRQAETDTAPDKTPARSAGTFPHKERA